jgi:hypothetical protein
MNRITTPIMATVDMGHDPDGPIPDSGVPHR